MHTARKTQRDRRGAAAVELALLLPFLFTMACGGMDFARIYYYSQVISDRARAGAMYAADPDKADETEFDTVDAAALDSTAGFESVPVVTVTNLADSAGNPCVAVNVSYSFPLLTRFLGIPSPVTLSRTAYARLYPAAE